MENIEAKSLNIKQLLKDRQYVLGYFQREYNWEKEHIEDLINDLIGEFNSQRATNNSQNTSDEKPFYFLGSIIISEENNTPNLIDGQQRLTSLSLILIYIARAYKELKEKIMPLIYTEKNGERVYTIYDLDRAEIMNALCDSKELNTDDSLISVKNIEMRFDDVENCFLEHELSNTAMVEFFDWLTERVYIAEVKALSASDGYKIFEAANDRGLSLTPVEMLKSYLLSGVEDSKEQNRLDELWKKRIDQIANANEYSSDAIKAWLRATLTSTAADFDNIGGEFHRWLRSKVKNGSINLNAPKDFINFIEEDFEFYTRWYLEIKKIAKNYSKKYEAVFCNQQNTFTLQYPLILSTLNKDDDEITIWKKINVVANFIDIYIARNLWNRASGRNRQSVAKKLMNEIAISIRGKDLQKIIDHLIKEIEKFEKFRNSIAPKNVKDCRYFLARFSTHLDEELEWSNPSLENYYNPKKCTLEHIMPNKYEYYKDVHNKEDPKKREFEDEEEFKQERNKLGAFVLLEASNNTSINKAPYEKKIDVYATQNLILAKTLAKASYASNPAFEKIVNQYNFKPFSEFLKEEIKDREKSYSRLAKEIWDPEKLKEIANDNSDDEE